MKKGRFLWSAHRITERQKAGKARNIKEKQLKNSRNTVLFLLVIFYDLKNIVCYVFFGIKVMRCIIRFNGSFLIN